MKRVDELRALLEKATPGEWYVSATQHNMTTEDAALIVAMRNTLPDLLDAVEAARKLRVAVYIHDSSPSYTQDACWLRVKDTETKLDAALAKLEAP